MWRQTSFSDFMSIFDATNCVFAGGLYAGTAMHLEYWSIRLKEVDLL